MDPLYIPVRDFLVEMYCPDLSVRLYTIFIVSLGFHMCPITSVGN